MKKFVSLVAAILMLSGCGLASNTNTPSSTAAEYTEANLIDFAYDQNLDKIREMLEQGFNVNYQDTNGNTALHIAIEQENQPLIELLMEYEADITIVNANRVTPLILSLQKDGYSEAEIIRFFMNLDANSPLLHNVNTGLLHHMYTFNSLEEMNNLYNEEMQNYIEEEQLSDEAALSTPVTNEQMEVDTTTEIYEDEASFEEIPIESETTTYDFRGLTMVLTIAIPFHPCF